MSPNKIGGEDSMSGSEMTLAVLGCGGLTSFKHSNLSCESEFLHIAGTMGIAILSGILADLKAPRINSPSTSISGASTPAEIISPPSRLPSRFIACVRRAESAKRIKDALKKIDPSLFQGKNNVKILQNSNLLACQEADAVLLCCKPYMVNDILAANGMAAALSGKLLISICAGVPVTQMETALYGNVLLDDQIKCRIVRALPNTASGIRESMTVIATSTPPLPEEVSDIVEWIFERVGKVVHLPPTTMDASTALCGSGPAFFALMMEATIDGAVAMGLPRAEAQKMAAQTMKGTAEMVLQGEHPALLRDKVTTPGGCTIGGLLVLEEGRVRGTVARAVREATVVASQLGKGVQGVNGTRF
jgi:pyrroline-5-carboxylate reductase